MALLLRVVLASFVTLSLSVAANADISNQMKVDQSFEAVKEAVQNAGLTEIIQIDHARLAAAENVEMPPSRVQLFSDPGLNAEIMKHEIRAGLDLPFRALSFDEAGALSLLYTSSDFLAKRHGITDAPLLAKMDDHLVAVFEQVPDLSAQKVESTRVDKDFAVLELRSQYGVAETVARLKETITAQSDTIWFGEIDFQSEAKAFGVELVPAQLLLFGGPAPGGVAMAEFPAIGLDAFCQKLLVYEGDDGKARVLFNDIAAFADLHYQRAIEPHAMLNKRLTATFKGAIE
ncbi:DUF302 domain-containing protein [Phaeobacter gallaeciensis]|uniref:DUF302 domain-containing protein n=1 Tax=Phaeobacter gallaeciensis TaxID=60890 RepID=A0A366X5N6_9RHOB|nr:MULTISPECIES: DUF302 domain-containing protein [Roseobacteraceae]MBT8168879.1 DUF302 domain-containing protein [Falsiruegeria litorea]RBW57657.1 DUF302 domain-containing protein [Phaeobacter gallaeciensis]